MIIKIIINSICYLLLKAKVLTFEQIVIDCTIENNNLILVDDKQTYTYCGNNTGNTFTFSTSNSTYVAIQKYGIVNFTMKIELLANYVPS